MPSGQSFARNGCNVEECSSWATISTGTESMTTIEGGVVRSHCGDRSIFLSSHGSRRSL